ncbi:ImmA/IrrE family metallo-endopeptidase [Amycolatopsis rubida]|uniref:Uncharacterized protein n=1 Tax=Amycolatopsis rubida TaxID=112413 RepID=A0A1I5DXT5_9PSEU|nr:ImmA/IrrE family metallo-endopeptidase [Amycolatopsis rubida]SFO03937.1 protein of unknown function [Amycolatopsis rubida]
MAEICARFGERRGKPIRLLAAPMDVPGPFGLWIKMAAADVILYQATGTTRFHQEHIIAHELGHLLADHPSDEGDDDMWRLLLPDIPPEAIRTALRRRTSYADEHEREAEALATVLLEATTKAQEIILPGRSPRARRAQTSLGDPVDVL